MHKISLVLASIECIDFGIYGLNPILLSSKKKRKQKVMKWNGIAYTSVDFPFALSDTGWFKAP